MEMCYITFRSVTYAQRGEQVLRSAGIGSNLQRTPKWMQEQGCGYCLRLRPNQVHRAVELLHRNGIAYRRIYCQSQEGTMREMVL